MRFLLILLCGGGAWYRPVLGFALFMFLQTPLYNAGGGLIHPYLGPVVLMVASVRLMIRTPSRSLRWRLQGLEICAMAFSVVVLVRQIALSYGTTYEVSIGVCWRALVSAFLWGPLLVAFNRLNEKEMENLRFWLAMAGIVVGLWGTLIFLTGNGFLMRTAIWTNPDALDATVDSMLDMDDDQLVERRFIVMGLFTVVTSAYWYALRGFFSQKKHHWLLNMSMLAGVGVMLVTVGVSVTRSLILLLGMGTAYMVVVQFMIKGGNKFNQLRAFVVMALGVCSLIVFLLSVDVSIILEQFQIRFSTFGLNDDSLIGRIENTSAAWDYIAKTLCLFGAPNPELIASVDTAVALRVWLTYGLVGVVLFAIMFLVTLWRLFKCGLSHRLSPDGQLLRGMLMAWAMTYVYAWMVGSSLHPAEVFFMMLFFSETERLKNKCRVAPDYGMWRNVV